eukprot:SAG31_NODE_55_length_29938_cov_9.154027_29_plen_86_part_00
MQQKFHPLPDTAAARKLQRLASAPQAGVKRHPSGIDHLQSIVLHDRTKVRTPGGRGALLRLRSLSGLAACAYLMGSNPRVQSTMA